MNILSFATKLLLATLLVSSAVLASHHADKSAAVIRYDNIQHPVIGKYGVVASQRMIASQVGADILARGGNAVDAAVATAMALAVVLPRAGNLGGGGFMLIHLAKQNKTIAIDYREMAPSLAHKDMYLNPDGTVNSNREKFSYLSSGVPGTVAGMAYALERYGTMSWKELLLPALKLARDGFLVPWDLSENLKRSQNWLTSNKDTAKAYYKAGAVAYEAGELLVQPDLANSLKILANSGPQAFYRGSIAKKIVAAMRAHGGLIRQRDLANYRALERPLIRTTYNGYTIASMPPPSSGGVHIAQMLNILELFPLRKMGYGSADSIHLMTEVMRLAYADRSEYLGDPDYFEVPIAALTSKQYARYLASQISPLKAKSSKLVKPGNLAPYESPDTTHFSIIDAQGNAVANTYTLNFSFGSGIVIPGTGILMNNEMADFAAKPGVPNAFGLLGGDANSIQPGKRPLSSMTPTMVFKNGRLYLVTGSPGGSRIITTVLQILLNVIDHDMNIASATHAPRIHHQWLPDKLYIEPGFSPDTLALLEAKGHKLSMTRTMGSVHSTVWKDGYFLGASDPRRPDAGAVGVMAIDSEATQN